MMNRKSFEGTLNLLQVDKAGGQSGDSMGQSLDLNGGVQ